MQTSIPQSIDELTPAWLTEVLRAGGGLDAHGAVSAFEPERIAEGVGFIGLIARLRLRYDGAPGPATLIFKVPTAEAGARGLAIMFGLYERETRFYTDLASEICLYSPRCYHAAMDLAAGRFVLVLEDLESSGVIGDQVEGCSDSQAELVIDELARLHAGWWQSPGLEERAWLVNAPDLFRPMLQGMYPAMLPVFMERFGDGLSPAMRDAMPGIDKWVLALLDRYEEHPVTLTHGDYRLDNMFFGRKDADYRLAVVDWQSFGRGWGAGDVAYFLCSNLPPPQRRALEGRLLARYHAGLVAGGVRDYSLDDLQLDVRRSLLTFMAMGVITGTSLEPTNERALLLFRHILERFTSAVTDTDALALLSG